MMWCSDFQLKERAYVRSPIGIIRGVGDVYGKLLEWGNFQHMESRYAKASDHAISELDWRLRSDEATIIRDYVNKRRKPQKN